MGDCFNSGLSRVQETLVNLVMCLLVFNLQLTRILYFFFDKLLTCVNTRIVLYARNYINLFLDYRAM